MSYFSEQGEEIILFSVLYVEPISKVLLFSLQALLRSELLLLWKPAVFSFILGYILNLIVQMNIFSDVKVLNMVHGTTGFLTGL